MENNLDEHMNYKQRQKRDEKPREIYSRSIQAEKFVFSGMTDIVCSGIAVQIYIQKFQPAISRKVVEKNQCTFFHYDKSKNTFLGRSPGWRAPQKY